MHSPTTSLRLSRQEVSLIYTGFRWILYRASDLNLRHHDSGLLDYIEEVASVIREINKRPPAATHRLHLDAMGCAMCIFALRLYGREVRRDKLITDVWPSAINRERLLKKLEKHRKRAKRKWLSQGEAASYQDWSVRWRRFLDWVRVALRPYRSHSMQDFYRRWIDQYFAFAKQVLATATNEDLPNDRELRKMVRKMVRHLRRGRGWASRLDIIRANDRGRRFVVWYMMREIGKYWAEIPATTSPETFPQSPAA